MNEPNCFLSFLAVPPGRWTPYPGDGEATADECEKLPTDQNDVYWATDGLAIWVARISVGLWNSDSRRYDVSLV